MELQARTGFLWLACFWIICPVRHFGDLAVNWRDWGNVMLLGIKRHWTCLENIGNERFMVQQRDSRPLFKNVLSLTLPEGSITRKSACFPMRCILVELQAPGAQLRAASNQSKTIGTLLGIALDDPFLEIRPTIMRETGVLVLQLVRPFAVAVLLNVLDHELHPEFGLTGYD